MPIESNLIAEMYFRLKTDSITHKRIVFSMMQYLGVLGGVNGIIGELLVFSFGGYLQFNAILQTFTFRNVVE